MLKPFKELQKVDVSEYVQKREKADYINWADMVSLAYEHGAEYVDYEPLFNEKKFPDGSVQKTPLFETDEVFGEGKKQNRCYYVGVRLYLDDKTYDYYVPVMNGAAAVNASYMSQQRIHNAQIRAVAKKLSLVTGIGFGLWRKTENAEEDAAFKEGSAENHDIRMVQKRVSELITTKMEGGVPMEEMAKACGMELDEFKSIFVWYKKLAFVEETVAGL